MPNSIVPSGSASLDAVENRPLPPIILRSYRAAKDLLRKLDSKKVDPEQVAEVWRESQNGNQFYLRPYFRTLIGADKIQYAVNGKSCTSSALPGYRFSLINGGTFSTWKKKGRVPKVWRHAIFTSTALILGKTAKEFPEVFRVVWSLHRRVLAGEIPDTDAIIWSDWDDPELYYAAKLALSVRWKNCPAYFTTVLRNAPTPTVLWKSVPDLHTIFPRPALLLAFLHKAQERGDRRYFRVVDIVPRGKARERKDGKTGGQRTAVLLERL